MTQQSDQQPHQAGGEDRTIAILAHLSPIIAMIVSAGFVSIAGPLLVWLIWRGRGPLVRNAAASSFNFHLTVWVAMVIGWILFFTFVLLPVGLVLIVVPGLLQLIFSIIGAVRASRGEVYRYPFQIRILN
ncbi:DUF4870 domain-containing protein [Ruania halotolerans]|uniref:DUF4870 domain-containing protein n=1 Tax=Ruania halotolerans TaxID=2897773 RepID=UPI001E418D24|nr:DUF4870 domain-containing protein [Ruania halotolerans]UFU07741.1 DUF4870 domain-containing protein [Ruania halotolerans]